MKSEKLLIVRGIIESSKPKRFTPIVHISAPNRLLSLCGLDCESDELGVPEAGEIEEVTCKRCKKIMSQSIKIKLNKGQKAALLLTKELRQFQGTSAIPCPRCGKRELTADLTYCYESRRDLQTYICYPCGIEEKMEDLGYCIPKAVANWSVFIDSEIQKKYAPRKADLAHEA